MEVLVFDDLAMHMFDDAKHMWECAQIENPDPSWQINCYVWECGSIERLAYRLGMLYAEGGMTRRQEYTRADPMSLPSSLLDRLPMPDTALIKQEFSGSHFSDVFQYIRSLYDNKE